MGRDILEIRIDENGNQHLFIAGTDVEITGREIPAIIGWLYCGGWVEE